MKKIFIILAGLLLVHGLLFPQDRITGRTFASRSEVIARHGMVCTSQPLVTQAALDILKKGGTAVDAAIAADALPGLMEPTGSGMRDTLNGVFYGASESRKDGQAAGY